MGMDMGAVYEGEESSAQNNIQIDATTIQRMNLRTALVERGPVRREFRTVGIVAYNEQGLRDITTKYDGWLEKLDVNATWTAVKGRRPALRDLLTGSLQRPAQLSRGVAFRRCGRRPAHPRLARAPQTFRRIGRRCHPARASRRSAPHLSLPRARRRRRDREDGSAGSDDESRRTDLSPG